MREPLRWIGVGSLRVDRLEASMAHIDADRRRLAEVEQRIVELEARWDVARLFLGCRSSDGEQMRLTAALNRLDGLKNLRHALLTSIAVHEREAASFTLMGPLRQVMHDPATPRAGTS